MGSSALSSSREIQAPPSQPTFGPAQFRLVSTFTAVAGGVFLLVFDAGWIPGVTNQKGAIGTYLILGVAIYLFAIAVACWIIFGRIAARRAIKLSLSTDGLRAVLASQSTLSFPWSTPSFEATIIEPSTDLSEPLSIQMKAGKSRASCLVTRQGAGLLQDEARRNNMSVESVVNGKPPQTWTMVTIRHP